MPAPLALTSVIWRYKGMAQRSLRSLPSTSACKRYGTFGLATEQIAYDNGNLRALCVIGNENCV